MPGSSVRHPHWSKNHGEECLCPSFSYSVLRGKGGSAIRKAFCPTVQRMAFFFTLVFLLFLGLLVALIVGDGIRVLVSSLVIVELDIDPFLGFLRVTTVGIGKIFLAGRFRIGRWSETVCVSCNLSESLRENEFMMHFEDVGSLRSDFNAWMKTWQGWLF